MLLPHGFPDGWYSWRHQLVAPAAAGCHVVAPDQRGYGRSGAPSAVEDYSILHLAGDAVGVLAADPRASLRRVLTGMGAGSPVVPPGGGFLDTLADRPALPAWLTEDDLDVHVAEYARNGFTGGLNRYRNLDRNWALTAAWHGAPITPPALFLAGEQDLVVAGIGADALAATLRRTCADLREEGAEQLRPSRSRPELCRALRGPAAARLRALDAAGTSRRGERRADRVRHGPGPLFPHVRERHTVRRRSVAAHRSTVTVDRASDW